MLASAEEIRKILATEDSKTDWRRAKSMPQAEVERLADEEDGILPEQWESTVEIGVPEPNESVRGDGASTPRKSRS